VCSAGPASASLTLVEGALSNKRMQLADASMLRNAGKCPNGPGPQLMRGPLGRRTRIFYGRHSRTG
jgi:hypothetical protein